MRPAVRRGSPENTPDRRREVDNRSARFRLVSEEVPAAPVLAAPRIRDEEVTTIPSQIEEPARLEQKAPDVHGLFGAPVVLQRESEPEDEGGKIPKIATDPKELRRITEILPYQDYEPDPEYAKNEPLRNQCPRPGAGDDECPQEVSFSNDFYAGRLFRESLYTWEASNLAYNPLYFEDKQLERYGHTYPECIQPLVSVGKFSTQLVFLPYQATIDPPCKCVYPLGYYRPGECAPKLCYQPPLNVDAAVVQAGVMTGFFFIFP